MRHLGIVASSAPQPSVPSITINSTTNFNENRATFNATVSPNGATTSVKFQFKKSVESLWNDGSTVTGLTGSSQAVFSNQTGLEINNATGTTYDVRAIATNSAGESTSSSTTFTTWSRKTYTKTTSGSETLTLQTVTPTGGSTVVPSIYEILVAGGGGGGRTQAGGGGAGGFRELSSLALNNASNLVLSIAVGAGGANGSNGVDSTLSGNFTTLTGGGGLTGPYNPTNGIGNNGGNRGSGDGSATGGIGYTNYDKDDNPDPNNHSHGGGAGWSGNGDDGGYLGEPDYAFTPGNGANGATKYNISGGAGGRGYANNAGTGQLGTNGTFWSGPSSGGQATIFGGDGEAKPGVVTFKYYGP